MLGLNPVLYILANRLDRARGDLPRLGGWFLLEQVPFKTRWRYQ